MARYSATNAPGIMVSDHDRSRARPRRPGADAWIRGRRSRVHLRRGVTTVQRWERQEGLPVHRHLHGTGESVFAYCDELDAWLASREPTAVPVASRPIRWPRRSMTGTRRPVARCRSSLRTTSSELPTMSAGRRSRDGQRWSHQRRAAGRQGFDCSRGRSPQPGSVTRSWRSPTSRPRVPTICDEAKTLFQALDAASLRRSSLAVDPDHLGRQRQSQ